TPDGGAGPVGLTRPSKETGLLWDTLAMLKAELEIRDEQLDLMGMQLELSREEVRKLRRRLGEQLESRSKEVQNLDLLPDSIQFSEPAHRTESYAHPLTWRAVAIAAQEAAGDEAPGTLAGPPDPVQPSPGTRPGYFRRFRRKFRRSFPPFLGLMRLGFSLPMFH
ncbi:MAG TPA: hypothetical protein VFR55_03760, partial [Dehalococcoidia bacterium]|nr:hypothetical protein [Dehalococcoidia bacterium]